MKKASLKSYAAGLLTITLLLPPTLALAQAQQTINVMFEKVKLVVNGKPMEIEALIYDDTIYIPPRTVAEVLNKEVSYDSITSTTHIDENGTKRTFDANAKSASVKDETVGIAGTWSRANEDGTTTYELVLGADGSYKENAFLYGSPVGSSGDATYKLASEGKMYVIFQGVYNGVLTDTIREWNYSLVENELKLWNENSTMTYIRGASMPSTPQYSEISGDERGSHSYGANAMIPAVIFEQAIQNIHAGDEQYYKIENTFYPIAPLEIAKPFYDNALRLLEDRGYSDTPLYKLALERWVAGP